MSNKLKVKADPPDVTAEDRRAHVRKLAGAIAHAIRNFGEVDVRSVGNPCIGKAAKALAISKEFMTKNHNLALYCVPGFIDVEMDDGIKTGIKFCAFTDEISTGRGSDDDTELFVASDGRGSDEERKNGVKKLAGAIAHALRESGSVKVRCFGNACIGKAAKSLAIARGFVAVNGMDLYCSPYFITAEIGGEEKTGIGFQVFVGGNNIE